VIVRCPSCRTCYHYRAESGQQASFGRCSRCDERVPLVSIKRDYLLDPAGARGATPPAPPPMGIGMDDPMLAPQLEAAAQDAAAPEPPKSLTYRIDARDPAPDAEAVPESAKAEAPEAEPPVEATRAPSLLREVLVTLLMTALGVAVTYHVAQDQGLDKVLWTAVGGGWGLLVGWACIRWMRRKR
jgi:hypothetical protein